MDGPCTWCLLALCDPSAGLQVQAQGQTIGETEGRMLADAQRDAYGGNLKRKAEIMTEAFAAGWSVTLNAYAVTEPVTTWHGDPICQTHLYAVAEKERQPQTVRMAQWGPREARSGRY